jgi:hypothetical protein
MDERNAHTCTTEEERPTGSAKATTPRLDRREDSDGSSGDGGGGEKDVACRGGECALQMLLLLLLLLVFTTSTANVVYAVLLSQSASPRTGVLEIRQPLRHEPDRMVCGREVR